MNTNWEIPVPAGGTPLWSLAVVGSGKDLDLRLDHADRARVVLPLDGATVRTAGDVEAHTSRIDDRNLRTEYSSPSGLLLTSARASWYDDFGGEVREDLESLFAATGDRTARGIFCVHVELSLAPRL